jgi:hypothetical protein
MKKFKIMMAALLVVAVITGATAFTTTHHTKQRTQGWFICNDPAHPLDASSYTYDEFGTENCASPSGTLCRVYVNMNGTDPDENDLSDLSDKTNGFTEPIDDSGTGDKVRLKNE